MRFQAWSKYDGQPLPARNRAELDALLAQGHTAEPPEEASNGDVSGDAGTDGDNPAGGGKTQRVQRVRASEGLVSGDDGDLTVPPATDERD